MREQLLGYLLGALEPLEQASVEAALAEDPALRRELEQLRAALGPLKEASEDEGEELDPPAGLGARTFQFVRNHAGWSALGQASGGTGAWKAPDYMIAAGIFLCASMLVFPAIQNSRSSARVTACQGKLRLLGVALAQYGQIYGFLPFVPAEGNLAAAGSYAPMMQEAGVLTNSAMVVCPESPLAKDRNFQVPTVRVLQTSDPETLQRLQRTMGGSYGYHPGHIENGVYVPTRNNAREHFAVMADASDDGSADRSSNHGKRGQNVLCQSGRVVFIVFPRLIENGDHIYMNELGVKGAGHGANDSSVSNSSVPPVPVQVRLSR